VVINDINVSIMHSFVEVFMRFEDEFKVEDAMVETAIIEQEFP